MEMKKVLIVDDEKRIRKIYRDLLICENFEVSEASTVNEAKEILKHEDITLILLDIKMPEANGNVLFDIARLYHKKVKIIVTSVYSIDEQKRIIPDADHYYDKSQGTRALLYKIKEVFNDAEPQY